MNEKKKERKKNTSNFQCIRLMIDLMIDFINETIATLFENSQAHTHTKKKKVSRFKSDGSKNFSRPFQTIGLIFTKFPDFSRLFQTFPDYHEKDMTFPYFQTQHQP